MDEEDIKCWNLDELVCMDTDCGCIGENCIEGVCRMGMCYCDNENLSFWFENGCVCAVGSELIGSDCVWKPYY